LGPVYAEYDVGHFTRAFTLSDKIDQEGISAELADGVLTLTLKKSKAALPRRTSKSAELGDGTTPPPLLVWGEVCGSAVSTVRSPRLFSPARETSQLPLLPAWSDRA
jgi:hypothetical protein